MFCFYLPARSRRRSATAGPFHPRGRGLRSGLSLGGGLGCNTEKPYPQPSREARLGLELGLGLGSGVEQPTIAHTDPSHRLPMSAVIAVTAVVTAVVMVMAVGGAFASYSSACHPGAAFVRVRSSVRVGAMVGGRVGGVA